MKNKIFRIDKLLLKEITKEGKIDEILVRVDASKIHDDSSFIFCVGSSFGMNSEKYNKRQNLASFNDHLCDFLSEEYHENRKRYVLILENWSNMFVDEEFTLGNGRICNWRKKEEYLEELETVIEFVSGFDPTDPEAELTDFTVFVVD